MESRLRELGGKFRFDVGSDLLQTPNLESMGFILNHHRLKSKKVFHGKITQVWYKV